MLSANAKNNICIPVSNSLHWLVCACSLGLNSGQLAIFRIIQPVQTLYKISSWAFPWNARSFVRHKIRKQLLNQNQVHVIKYLSVSMHLLLNMDGHWHCYPFANWITSSFQSEFKNDSCITTSAVYKWDTFCLNSKYWHSITITRPLIGRVHWVYCFTI